MLTGLDTPQEKHRWGVPHNPESHGDRGVQDRRAPDGGHVTRTHVTFRASPVLVARLDRLAEATGSSRSAAIKRAILEATTPAETQPVPDEHEVLLLLSEAARGGSVAAMRELLAYHRERRQGRRPDAVDALDELAERRGGT